MTDFSNKITLSSLNENHAKVGTRSTNNCMWKIGKVHCTQLYSELVHISKKQAC